MNSLLKILLPVIAAGRPRVNVFVDPKDPRAVQAFTANGDRVLVQGVKDPRGELLQIDSVLVADRTNGKSVRITCSNFAQRNQIDRIILDDGRVVDVSLDSDSSGEFTLIMPDGRRFGPVAFRA